VLSSRFEKQNNLYALFSKLQESGEESAIENKTDFQEQKRKEQRME
jgi:hypothetical protein